MEPRAAPRPDQRTINRHTKQLWVAKLSLRIVSSVLCLPLIGCAAFMLSLKGPGAPVLPQACLVLFWNVAEVTTLLVRRRAGLKGIHPGVCVGVDLILWLGLATGAVLLCFWLRGMNPAILPATVAMAILVTLLQIALFIIACVETHRRNSQPDHANYNPTQQPPAVPAVTAQAGVRCRTCAPGMSCANCVPPMNYPTPAAGWPYKPELAGPTNATQPVAYEVAAQPYLVQQHEMPAVAASPQPHEMWTGNAPRYEMYVQDGGHGNRQELAPQ